MNSAAYESIKDLCMELEFDFDPDIESDHVKELKSILKAHPDVVNERDPQGTTLLHLAAKFSYRSVEFIKTLVEMNVESVKIPDAEGNLPFHHACSGYSKKIEIIEYLYEMYPESINTPNSEGLCPIHKYLESSPIDFSSTRLDTIHFLIKHDQGALSTSTPFGNIPLHIACGQTLTKGLAEAVFDAYPEGIDATNSEGQTPLDESKELLNNFDDPEYEFIEELPGGNGQMKHLAGLRVDYFEAQLKIRKNNA